MPAARLRLRPELEDAAGADHSVLCEFPARLVEQDGTADRLLQLVLDRLVEVDLLEAGGLAEY